MATIIYYCTVTTLGPKQSTRGVLGRESKWKITTTRGERERNREETKRMDFA
jgi:hypothetical protein